MTDNRPGKKITSFAFDLNVYKCLSELAKIDQRSKTHFMERLIMRTWRRLREKRMQTEVEAGSNETYQNQDQWTETNPD